MPSKDLSKSIISPPPLAHSPKVAGPVVELTPEMAIAASRRRVKNMESKASLRRLSASFIDPQPSSPLLYMEMDQPSMLKFKPASFSSDPTVLEPINLADDTIKEDIQSVSHPASVKNSPIEPSMESALAADTPSERCDTNHNKQEQKETPDKLKRNSWWFWSSPMEITPVTMTTTTTCVTTTTTMTTTVTHRTTTIAPVITANNTLQSVGAGEIVNKSEVELPVENPHESNSPTSATPVNSISNTIRYWGLGWFYNSLESSSTSPENSLVNPKACEKSSSAHPKIEELVDNEDTQQNPKRAISSNSISSQRPLKQSMTIADMDIKPKANNGKLQPQQLYQQQQDGLSSSVSSTTSTRKKSIWGGLFQQSNQSLDQLSSDPPISVSNITEPNSVSTDFVDHTPDQSDTESRKLSQSKSLPPASGANATTSTANGTKKRKKSVDILRPNLVLPALEDNFPIYSTTRTFKNSLKKFTNLWFAGKNNSATKNDSIISNESNLSTAWTNPGNSESQHLYRSSNPKQVSRVVVVGVHGFFPMKMLRSFIGEPTGTSLKFATEGAHAFEAYGRKHGMDIVVDKISLEGEGKVRSRVDSLYKRLLEYTKIINGADCVFFAAHSQGTPVAAHLLARLVEDGYVEGKVIGMVGMAGISLGPFSGLDQTFMVRAYSSIESSSLGELFQFQDPTSVHSRKYVEALRTIIAHNAKIVFVGSINDQVVPLYSATCMHVTHPNILRAVYVDGSSEVSPEFISNLVGLALRLKNVGCSDHGLIREISASLAGSLRGGGHSRIYDEQSVYELAIRHLLETTDPDPALPVLVDTDFQVPSRTNHNPYLLPWSLHGMFTEAAARTRLRPALDELIREFRAWTPESKALKDIKYRLSAVQAKL